MMQEISEEPIQVLRELWGVRGACTKLKFGSSYIFPFPEGPVAAMGHDRQADLDGEPWQLPSDRDLPAPNCL